MHRFGLHYRHILSWLKGKGTPGRPAPATGPAGQGAYLKTGRACVKRRDGTRQLHLTGYPSPMAQARHKYLEPKALARLGKKVKKMIGGVEGWKDEGFTLSASGEK